MKKKYLIAVNFIFLLLIFTGCKEYDGETKVSYNYTNKDYVTDVSHDNLAVPQDFRESKTYDCDTGTYTVFWTIDNGSTTKDCSSDYRISSPESGALCNKGFISDELLNYQGCAQVKKTSVHFGASLSFLGIPVFNCSFSTRTESYNL